MHISEIKTGNVLLLGTEDDSVEVVVTDIFPYFDKGIHIGYKMTAVIPPQPSSRQRFDHWLSESCKPSSVNRQYGAAIDVVADNVLDLFLPPQTTFNPALAKKVVYNVFDVLEITQGLAA